MSERPVLCVESPGDACLDMPRLTQQGVLYLYGRERPGASRFAKAANSSCQISSFRIPSRIRLDSADRVRNLLGRLGFPIEIESLVPTLCRDLPDRLESQWAGLSLHLTRVDKLAIYIYINVYICIYIYIHIYIYIYLSFCMAVESCARSLQQGQPSRISVFCLAHIHKDSYSTALLPDNPRHWALDLAKPLAHKTLHQIWVLPN